MEEKTALDQLPSRIKYYLLDWKDKNMNGYIGKYGVSLRCLTHSQLSELFFHATTKDRELLKM